ARIGLPTPRGEAYDVVTGCPRGAARLPCRRSGRLTRADDDVIAARKDIDGNRSEWADAGPDRGEDASRGPLVGLHAHHVRGLHGVRHLCDVAGLQRPGLLRRAVPLSVLLAVPRRLRARFLRLRAAVRVVAAVVGADHPDLPARLPDDLLLLPEGLL